MATSQSTKFNFTYSDGNDAFDYDKFIKQNLQKIEDQIYSKLESDAKFIYIVDQQTNANGTYVKYSDGRLECFYNESKAANTYTWATPTVSGTSSTYYNVVLTWTFPLAFKTGTTPVVFVSGDCPGSGVETHSAYSQTATLCSIEHGILGTDPRNTAPLNWSAYARGYWK